MSVVKKVVNPGDKVTWEIRAQGIRKRKSGTVIAVIPPGKDARKRVPSTAKESHIQLRTRLDVFERFIKLNSGGCNIEREECAAILGFELEKENNGGDS